MEAQQLLETHFGIAFEKQPSMDALRQFHVPNGYCTNETGAIIGICATTIEAAEIVVPDLPDLVYLNLGDNEHLVRVRFEAALPKLSHLDISDSQLETFKLPAGFSQLRWLDLSRNQLSRFIPMGEGQFGALAYLDLSGNQLSDFSAHLLERFPNLELLFLQRNPLPSAKIAACDAPGSCLPFMQRFLRELGKGETENKEYKVLVVGNGGVGKSCLVERLVYDSFEQRHLSTQGVALEQYRKDPFPYILNLWDFGGQDIYHATHRLFMQANAVYLALWDEETLEQPFSAIEEAGEIREYPNFPLAYWLHYIRQQGGKSPIIAVKTKSNGQDRRHPQLQSLTERYKVYEFTRVDSELDDPIQNGFRRLLNLQQEVIEGKLGIEKELPVGWDKLRQHLRTLQQKGGKIILLDEYFDIASDYDIEEPEKVLVQWLVPTGVVFYRPGYFSDTIILQQGWAIEAIYRVFDRNSGWYYKLKDAQKGLFSGADLQRIWREKNYSQAEQELLVDFMLSCEICFEVTPPSSQEDSHTQHADFSDRQFIAPQLLPNDAPSIAEMIHQQQDRLHVRYRHDFLHYGIIQSFIVRTQEVADARDIWQQGTVLRQGDRFAMVAVERTKGRQHAYDIYVNASRENPELLDKIRNTLEELQGESVEEWVSTDGLYYVPVHKLKNWKQAQIVGTHIETGTEQLLDTAKFQIFLGQRKQERFEGPKELQRERAAKMVEQIEREQLMQTPISVPELKLGTERPTILFVQANPTLKDINWKAEYTDIQVILNKNKNSSFDLKPCQTASLMDLQEAIEEFEPHILHFCGHGLEKEVDRSGYIAQNEGLAFHNAAKNDVHILTTQEAARLFRRIKGDIPSLSVVLLSACHSSAQAAAISEAGFFTIGTSEVIYSESARLFAAGFYRNLNRGVDFMVSIQRGITSAIVFDEDIEKLIEVYYNGHRIYPQ